MSPKAPSVDHLEQACRLDERGRREQEGRYARLAASVTRLDRTADAVLIEFDERLDRDLLDRTLAVERECCPFFGLEVDEGRRLLRVTVREERWLPALDAVAHVFGQGEPVKAES